MSELALKLIAKEKEEKTGSLDLGNCGLRELPQELFELTHLERLVIADWHNDYKIAKRIESSNEGPINLFQDIPAQITLLTNLKVLIIANNCSKWDIEAIPSLEDLSQLQTLILSGSEISNIRFL